VNTTARKLPPTRTTNTNITRHDKAKRPDRREKNTTRAQHHSPAHYETRKPPRSSHAGANDHDRRQKNTIHAEQNGPRLRKRPIAHYETRMPPRSSQNGHRPVPMTMTPAKNYHPRAAPQSRVCKREATHYETRIANTKHGRISRKPPRSSPNGHMPVPMTTTCRQKNTTRAQHHSPACADAR